MTSEQQIEQEIQDKGLNAPRLTPDDIDNQIISEIYITGYDAINAAMNSGTGLIKSQYQEGVDLLAPAETLTFCILILKNGFTATGESACVSPENFNAETGRKVARENAREKIWQLEGYLLKEKLHQTKLDQQF
ncbi:Gp49 family protein [Acinetobacter sp. ANC 4640]